MKLIRYCYECGHVGEIDRVQYPLARDCCPDGNHAAMVPEGVVAEIEKLQDEVRLKTLSLHNCMLYAARRRKEAWAAPILFFCKEGGVAPNPLRAPTQGTNDDSGNDTTQDGSARQHEARAGRHGRNG